MKTTNLFGKIKGLNKMGFFNNKAQEDFDMVKEKLTKRPYPQDPKKSSPNPVADFPLAYIAGFEFGFKSGFKQGFAAADDDEKLDPAPCKESGA